MTTKRRKLTNKEKVLKKHPFAFCVSFAGLSFRILDGDFKPLKGRGATPDAAWADAARRLK